MSIQIGKLDGPFGAEVVGLDIRAGVGQADRARLQQAWVDNVVVCIRGQKLSPGEFVDVAGIFGQPEPQPIQREEYAVAGYPEIRVLSSLHTDTNGDGKPLLTGGTWHTDHSHLPAPPSGTMLYAITLPATGGDTSFTNQTAAYEGLPAALRDQVDSLIGRHVYNSRYAPRRLQTMTPGEAERAPSAQHPLVRTHDVTGRPALYFNPIRIEQFAGLSVEESQTLIKTLVAHCEQPDYVYRHRWREGDVLLWDNRQALHMVAHDYEPGALRLMHRTLVRQAKPTAA